MAQKRPGWAGLRWISHQLREVRNFKFLDNLNHIAVVLCTSLDNAVKVRNFPHFSHLSTEHAGPHSRLRTWLNANWKAPLLSTSVELDAEVAGHITAARACACLAAQPTSEVICTAHNVPIGAPD